MEKIMKKIIFSIMAVVMLLFTIATAVSAYSYNYQIRSDLYPAASPYTYYYYSQEGSGWPDIYGPYPRYYIGYDDSLTVNNYAHDDFHHYDDFEGYRDLDVFNIDGTIDILRNPNAEINPGVPAYGEGNYSYFGDHVYGFLPDGSTYRKHYHHEHAWEGEDYNYGYYYAPMIAYRQKPICSHPCQIRSICEKTHSCCY